MIVSPKHLLYPSNLLSLTRLVLAGPVTYLIANPALGRDRLLIALIGVAIVTDLLDGYVSRILNEVSDLGKALDPLADKVIILSGIVTAVIYRGFPALIVLLLAYRDLLLVICGVVLTRRLGKIATANRWGKLNTFFVAFLCLFYAIDPNMFVTRVFSYASVVMVVVSAVSYYAFGEPHLVRGAAARWGFRLLFVVIPVVLAAILWRLAPGITWI